MAFNHALSGCEAFSTLSNAELEKIASLTTSKDYEAGAILFQEGDSADEFFVLEAGKVALQIMVAKPLGQTTRRVTVDIIDAGEIIDWSAVIEPYTYTLTGVCLQKARVLSISGSKLRWLLQNEHEIGYELTYRLIKVLSSKLDDTRKLLISERAL